MKESRNLLVMVYYQFFLNLESKNSLDLKIVIRKISILRLLEEFMFLFFPKYLFHFVTQRLTH